MPKTVIIRTEKMKAYQKLWNEANRDKRKEYEKQYHIRHPDRANVATRKYMRKRREKAASRPRPVDGCCEVCGGTQKRALHWDHDLKTGLFRGWLCGNCNRALGFVKDDIVRLEKLIVYLKKFN
jgi:hypothetical protein